VVLQLVCGYTENNIVNKRYFRARIRHVVGIDEAGRGPLAGPVAVGAVFVYAKKRKYVEKRLTGIRDSKKISQRKREEWVDVAKQLRQEGLIGYTVSFVGASSIDARGIEPAVRTGLKRSLLRLNLSPQNTHILLDGGLYAPNEYSFQETIIRGDESEPLISLAAILAKVRRDRYMERLSLKYPEYGFECHKGYGTAKHVESIRSHGMSVMHREGFVHI